MISFIVSTKISDISFVISLAGSGLIGTESQIRQMEDDGKRENIDEKLLKKMIEAQKKINEAIIKDQDDTTLRSYFTELIKLAAFLPNKPQMDDQYISLMVESALQVSKLPSVKDLLTIDPREFLRKITIPVLAIHGSLDIQVNAKENLEEISKSLREAGNSDVTIMELPGLNHNFQTAKTGFFEEYEKIEETISPKVLELLASWIKQR